jgi:ATP-binding cassette subfamily B (MDR/TAP) protein 1
VTVKNGFYSGLSFGLIMFVMLADYALGFWYGSLCIGGKYYNSNTNKVYTTGDVFIIFFSILNGGFSLG